ncbi:methionine--tRNA ligase [Sulfodiicoccus acidiphilus]|uniref:Methionine--tRNA ligase n=1 Tax=Sulfodiicoccus acidiphilus TaxID=1670455 RepID=A0A348B0N2_9CREN|nr:methionine--tRNA ligase subunit beta [Sulfodiicoccus acidiphilus]BBD71734.1 methionine--tRNA ligase [Sulfodiicoccus acidiphilus]GGT86250.1 methionine--tRNA ligase [Sulfodiicoccus acidiphilus]
MEEISIEDFRKLELRVAIVTAAERIPGTRLLRLEVSTGQEKRQIVSGIAEYYEPEQLLNRKVVIVYNLKPRVIRGYESQGMILAAGCEDGTSVKVVTVDEGASPGSKVC